MISIIVIIGFHKMTSGEVEKYFQNYVPHIDIKSLLPEIIHDNNLDDPNILGGKASIQHSYVIKCKGTDGKMYVVKMRASRVTNTWIKNCAFIGLCGLNKLDSPHFARILDVNFNIPIHISYTKPYTSIKYTEYIPCNMIIMEYIEGISLDEFVNTATSTEMKSVLRQMINALHHANKNAGFVHNDLALVNIMIKPDLTPVIIDFDGSNIHFRTSNGEIINIGFHPTHNWAYDMETFLFELSNQLNYSIHISQRLDHIYEEIRNSYDCLINPIKEGKKYNDEMHHHHFIIYNALDRLKDHCQVVKTSTRAYDLGPIIAKLLKVLESTKDYNTFVTEAHNIII